jgi:hypothetical protein
VKICEIRGQIIGEIRGMPLRGICGKKFKNSFFEQNIFVYISRNSR